MPKKEGKIIATGINPQGVPWKEISYVEERQEKQRKGNLKKTDSVQNNQHNP